MRLAQHTVMYVRLWVRAIAFELSTALGVRDQEFRPVAFKGRFRTDLAYAFMWRSRKWRRGITIDGGSFGTCFTALV
jgi:hypothetical protein